MKIVEDYKDEYVEYFFNIKTGGCFKYFDDIYIKTDDYNAFYEITLCVKLKNGDISWFGDVIKVIPLSSEVKVKKI